MTRMIIVNAIRLGVGSQVHICPAQAMQNLRHLTPALSLFGLHCTLSLNCIDDASDTSTCPSTPPHFSQQKRPVCSNAPSPRTQNAVAWASSPSLSPSGATACCCSSHPKQVQADRAHGTHTQDCVASIRIDQWQNLCTKWAVKQTHFYAFFLHYVTICM